MIPILNCTHLIEFILAIWSILFRYRILLDVLVIAVERQAMCLSLKLRIGAM